MRELTERQREVRDFWRQHLSEQQRPPTFVEMAEHFGWRSLAAVSVHMDALVKKGVFERRGGRYKLRGVRVLLVPSEPK